MTKYNGHDSWAYWNVSLWLNNDEGLHDLTRRELKRARNKDEAAARIAALLAEIGLETTPDGARYSKSAIRAAIRD